MLAVSVYLAFLFRSSFALERFLPYGYLGIFSISLISSCSIFFPLPGDAIVIGASVALNPFWLTVVASLGASIGELSGYFIGYSGKKMVLGESFSERVERWMKRYGVFAIFIFALIPFLIFDIVGLVAGALRYPLWKFFLACLAGRLLRTLVEVYVGWNILNLIPFLSGVSK